MIPGDALRASGQRRNLGATMATRLRPATGMALLEARRLPPLSGTRVLLRSLRDRDADDIHAIFSDPETTRFWNTTAMQSKAEARRLIREIREEQAQGLLWEWGLTLGQEDRVIGTCALFHLDRDNRRAEVGFALGRPWWGRGLMREGLGVLIDFCFEELDLRRLEADVDPRNAASIGLLERFGFRREGLLRERWNVGGELQDTVIYGLLRREYRAAGEGPP